MASYSVVSMYEPKFNGEIEEKVVAVPSLWLFDNNTKLFWPPANYKFPEIKALLKNVQSKPDTNTWRTFTCKLRMANISTYREAIAQEKFFCECSDTEQERE